MGRSKKVKLVVRNPQKLVKLDQPMVDTLGKKRAKLVRKLVNRMHSVTSKAVHLPINIPLKSVDIVCKTKEESWFHDKTQETLRLLLRLEGLHEDGLGRHLTPTAKVVQWVLWVPLIGDPYTSRSAPDRVWRESNFATPAEFLLSYVTSSKAEVLGELVGDRWDAGMMLGGKHMVRKFIDEHIRDDNDFLRECITQWFKPLKWHQEWDWETLLEAAMFGDTAPKFDVFWESDAYQPGDSFNLTPIWSPGASEVGNVVRNTLASIPGNEKFSEALTAERTAAEAASGAVSTTQSPGANKTFTASSSSGNSGPTTPVRMSGWTGVVSPLSMRKVARYKNSFATPSMLTAQRPKFRPDMPFDGANKLAFERFFEKSSPYTSGRKKRIRDYQFGKNNNKKAKTGGFFPGASTKPPPVPEDEKHEEVVEEEEVPAQKPKRKVVRVRTKRKSVSTRKKKRKSAKSSKKKKTKSRPRARGRSKSKSRRGSKKKGRRGRG